MPVIEGIEASSASTVMTPNTLKGNSLILATSSAASISASVEYENIQITASSASNQTIKGKSLQIEAETSSAGVINAGELLSNEVVASSSSGGSTTVHPIVNLKADASSGGHISYIGTPKTSQKEENSGGSINED